MYVFYEFLNFAYFAYFAYSAKNPFSDNRYEKTNTTTTLKILEWRHMDPYSKLNFFIGWNPPVSKKNNVPNLASEQKLRFSARETKVAYFSNI